MIREDDKDNQSINRQERRVCPMAELVTASDCYFRLEVDGLHNQSEGREFEPHWGSFFFHSDGVPNMDIGGIERIKPADHLISHVFS